jgi:GTP-binding protein
MIIRSATFITSSTSLSGCPQTSLPEFAFIGRSNVGKSSLINMLIERKNLAKTSSTPGKTQTINHFLVNERWHLVDLPGYGYASAAKRTKRSWPQMISTYLKNRENLINTFVLIDSRLEPQVIDKEFIQWAGESKIPFAIVFTKVDKLGRSARAGALQSWSRELTRTWAELPPMIVTSATERLGRKELLDYIEQSMKVSDL